MFGFFFLLMVSIQSSICSWFLYLNIILSRKSGGKSVLQRHRPDFHITLKSYLDAEVLLVKMNYPEMTASFFILLCRL